VLDDAKQAIELEDVEVRVATLEQAAQLQKSGEREGARQFLDVSRGWRIRGSSGTATVACP